MAESPEQRDPPAEVEPSLPEEPQTSLHGEPVEPRTATGDDDAEAGAGEPGS